MEPDEEKRPVLTLKAPQNIREYFEFKNVPDEQRSAATYARMVHDEYVRVARALVDTGMPPEITTLVDRLQEFFPEAPALISAEPFPLGLLASQALAGPGGGE
jgi:hypothetical protein